MGLSVVALAQPPHFTIGFLANNDWSMAGHSDRDKPAVNPFLLPYFVNYNLKHGWYHKTSPIITANWRSSNGNVVDGAIRRWRGKNYEDWISACEPLHAVPRQRRLPEGTSTWNLQVQIAFLFPRLTKQQKKMLLEQKLKQMNQVPSQKK
jgi:hypothetical protein